MQRPRSGVQINVDGAWKPFGISILTNARGPEYRLSAIQTSERVHTRVKMGRWGHVVQQHKENYSIEIWSWYNQVEVSGRAGRAEDISIYISNSSSKEDRDWTHVKDCWKLFLWIRHTLHQMDNVLWWTSHRCPLTSSSHPLLDRPAHAGSWNKISRPWWSHQWAWSSAGQSRRNAQDRREWLHVKVRSHIYKKMIRLVEPTKEHKEGACVIGNIWVKETEKDGLWSHIEFSHLKPNFVHLRNAGLLTERKGVGRRRQVQTRKIWWQHVRFKSSLTYT